LFNYIGHSDNSIAIYQLLDYFMLSGELRLSVKTVF